MSDDTLIKIPCSAWPDRTTLGIDRIGCTLGLRLITNGTWHAVYVEGDGLDVLAEAVAEAQRSRDRMKQFQKDCEEADARKAEQKAERQQARTSRRVDDAVKAYVSRMDGRQLTSAIASAIGRSHTSAYNALIALEAAGDVRSEIVVADNVKRRWWFRPEESP